FRAGLFEGLEGEPCRVGACWLGNDPATRPLAPDLQLLDAGGSERIAGREHHVVSRVSVLLCELGDRRRLAAAIDADKENDKGLAAKAEAKWFHDRLDEP